MEDLSNENVIHINKNRIEYLQFRKLLQYKDIVTHAYSLGKKLNFRTSKPNNEEISKEEYKNAISDYKDISSELGSNYINIVKTNQDHTDKIQIINQKINKHSPDINNIEYSKTDGFITKKRNIILSTTNADCILLLFFDPVKKIIANVHSGWKGTIKRISVKTIKKMKQNYGCNPKDIIVCMCPSIRKCHFEVDENVKYLFEQEFSELDLDNIIIKQENKEKWNIDTILINKLILEKEGLLKENIVDSGICSVCNSNLIHSYRVEKEGYGLSTALIELK